MAPVPVPPQRLKHCFPTYDVEGKKEFRTVATAIIQELCDKQLVTKECAMRAGSVLNVPEGHRWGWSRAVRAQRHQDPRCIVRRFRSRDVALVA